VADDNMVINPGFRQWSWRPFPHEQTEAYKEYRWKWDNYPKQHAVAEFPLNLDIEVTNKCNLACPFCVREHMNEGTGLMPFTDYQRLMAEAKQYRLPAVKLNWRGEPTLHPMLPQMVKQAKEMGVLEVMINTNGTLLTKELCGRLIDAGLDKLIVSIESIDFEVYKTYRVGGELPEVLTNIKTLLRQRDIRVKETPVIRVQKVDFPQTRGEDYVGFFHDLGVDQVAINSYKEKNPDVVDWKPKPCCQPWQRLVISWKGDIFPCCQGHLFEPIGNTHRTSLHAAWHSDAMKRLRDLNALGEGYKCGCRSCEVTKGA